MKGRWIFSREVVDGESEVECRGAIEHRYTTSIGSLRRWVVFLDGRQASSSQAMAAGQGI